MKFESVDDVVELLRENEQIPEHIQQGRENYVELKALIKGEGYKELLIKIEHIESEKKKNVRRKYARSIKDMNTRLLRNLDNVYNATGGSKDYTIEEGLDDKQRGILLNHLKNVRDNKSLEKYFEDIWINDCYHVDPMGVQFMEYIVNEEEDTRRCYPTYKSINDIRNYLITGQNLEWIIFEKESVIDEVTGETYERIRFVDDNKDYRFKKIGIKDEITGKTNYEYTLINELTFEHPFGKCPGLINSDLVKIGTQLYISPVSNIIELEKEILRDQSIKTIFKFQRGFPKFWRYKMVCPSCRGFGKKGAEKCDVCNGTGFFIESGDVSDEVVLSIPETKEDAVITGDIAGYIQPPIETWDKFNEELEFLEQLATETHWGSHKAQSDESKEKTAFEVWLNSQPVMSRLNKYSSVAEFMEWQFTEWIANFLFPSKDKKKSICNINYGRNYIIQPVEYIFETYQKSDGLNTIIRDRQLKEYITTKNRYNPSMHIIEIKKMQIEPYIHYKLKDIHDIFGPKEAQRKIMFSEWWYSLENDDIKKTETIKLKEAFNIWFDEYYIEPDNIVNSQEVIPGEGQIKNIKK